METQSKIASDQCFKARDLKIWGNGEYLSFAPAALLQSSVNASEAFRNGSTAILNRLAEQHFGSAMKIGRDEPLNLRFKIGALTDEEQSEWVLRSETVLNVPNGGVCIRRGELDEQRDPLSERLSSIDEEIVTIDIPIGTWKLTVFGFVPSELAKAGLQNAASSLPAWFRETRGTTGIPAWLLAQILKDPSLDRGFEAHWGAVECELNRKMGHCWNLKISQLAEKYLNYLFLFTPHYPAATKGEIDRRAILEWEVRVPILCPLGIPCVA